MAQSPLTPLQVVQRAAARAVQDDAALENYAYHQRDILSTLNRSGKPPSVREDETEAVSEVDGIEYDRVIARDGKSLTPKDAAREQRKAAEFIRKHSGAEAREKALAKQAKEQKQQAELIAAIPTAFTLAFASPATANPCNCYVVVLTPRPGIHTGGKNLKTLRHVAATAWVDRSDFSTHRIEIHVLKPMNAGSFLMRMEPGSTVTMENENVDGHWFEKSVEAAITARVFLVKQYHVLFDETCGDYRKFSVSTKVMTGKVAGRH
ncbi:MAG: hypothetical protein ACRD0Y_10475 [Terriglobales bacterium]